MKLKKFKWKESFFLIKIVKPFSHWDYQEDYWFFIGMFSILYWVILTIIGGMVVEKNPLFPLKLYFSIVSVIYLIVFLVWKIVFNLKKGE